MRDGASGPVGARSGDGAVAPAPASRGRCRVGTGPRSEACVSRRQRGAIAWKFLVPLAVFAALVVFLGVGLTRDPKNLPSPLIDKPAPAFSLAKLDAPGVVMTPAEMRGKVWLLNVWASWCAACRIEHPLMVELAKAGVVPIVGFNFKDEPQAAQRWLDELGDPYVASVMDRDGRAGIEYGVYGAPETFLIDRDGVIRFKQVGPITPEVLRDRILPLVKRLQG
jgi:cytochrome c biogenesis protein CcmG/thiol:disulfide interchange protein DsbE